METAKQQRFTKWHVEITNTRNGTTYRPPIKGEIKIYWKRSGDAGKIELEVINVGDLDFQNGHPLVLYRNGLAVFAGFVFRKQRSCLEYIKVTAYDQLRYLKYKDTIQYEGKSYSDLVKMVAKDRGLPLGDIADTAVKLSRTEENAEFYEMFVNASKATIMESGKMFILYDDCGKLQLKEIKEMAYTDRILDESQMESWEYTNSIDDGTYNMIKLHVRGGGSVMAQNLQHVKEWGRLQYHAITTEPVEVVGQRAQDLLKLVDRPVRSLSLKNVIGDIKIRGGSLVAVRLPLGDMNLMSWFIVESVTHKIKGNNHSMDMEIINEQFLPAISIDGAFKDEQSGNNDGGKDFEAVPETSNAARAWNYLRSRGYSAAATAGVLGNLDAESGIDPRILQNGRGPGTGIAQWENPGRWNLLAKWAQAHGKDKWALETQLAYLVYELEGGEATTVAILANRFGGINAFKKASDPVWATRAFYESFERGSIHRMEVRYASAKKYFNQWKNYQKVPPTAKGSGVASGKFLFPVPSNRAINQDNPFGGANGHLGIDIPAPTGAKIIASNGGTVVHAGTGEHWSYGISVVIDHGGGIKTRYAHCSSVSVQSGQSVSKGQQVAQVGNTGNSFGSHLHFEVWKNGAVQNPNWYVNPSR